MAAILNSSFGPGRHGPADGDPFHRAVHDAAEFLDGVPAFAPTVPGTPDRIYALTPHTPPGTDTGQNEETRAMNHDDDPGQHSISPNSTGPLPDTLPDMTPDIILGIDRALSFHARSIALSIEEGVNAESFADYIACLNAAQGWVMQVLHTRLDLVHPTDITQPETDPNPDPDD